MANAVMIKAKTQSQDIDALNRSAVCAADLENSALVMLTGKSTTSGETEVFTAVAASTGDGLTGVWMVCGVEDVITYSGTNAFKGLDPDPRNFINKATHVFDVFKPKVGDLLLLSEDCFTGAKSTNTYGNCTNGTSGLLVWGASQTASVFSVKYLATEYISIPDGSISTGRVTAYLCEVVAE